MNKNDFEHFISDNGKDILRFCKITAGSEESGSDLYQDTMLKLLEKLAKLDSSKNIKSYALSISILLWKSKKKKYAVRRRIAPISSLEEFTENGEQFRNGIYENSPEQMFLDTMEQNYVRILVADLPEKYRLPVYLKYSANMKMTEIAECLHIPVNTVKTRIRKAKQILKEQLEAIGYDR